MNLADLPQMTTGGYMHSTYGGGILGGEIQPSILQEHKALAEALKARAVFSLTPEHEPFSPEPFAQQNEPNETMNTKRIVRVFIADPDSRVPIEASLLYKGDEQVTDLTDQELFYEVPIKEALANHNASRVKTVDKHATAKAGKDIFLEPIKIRDLKMTVVVVAAF